MFLKSLELYGFKSFADRTHINFVDGITALIGPNGCGKSNIVDAVKWVLGEQSMKTIRAGKKEDVIFNGTDTRKPMTFAEVTLVIDNSAHTLPTDVEEIEIKRRVFRSGESEYYLNKQRCLLRNIQELFFDTGVGKSAYSILEQGKIDQILSTKPEDRRYIFEEAAGISRFKAQCNEAQNKLQRTEENISDIEIQAREAKRICDRTRTQAEKAIKAKDLEKRAFELDVQFHLGQLRTYSLMNDERARLLAEAQAESERLQNTISSITDQINAEQEAVRTDSDNLHALQLKMTTLDGLIQSAEQAISMLNERYQDYAITERSSRDKAEEIKVSIDRDRAEIESYEETVRDNEERLEEEERQISALRKMLEDNTSKNQETEDEISRREERNNELDQDLQRLSEELKSLIEELISEVDENTGTEYSSERRENAEKALRDKAGELTKMLQGRIDYISSLKEDVPLSKEITVRDFSKVSSGLDEMIAAFTEYKASIPPVIDTLLSPEGLISRKREAEKKEQEVRSEIIANRHFIDDARERVRILRSDTDSLRDAIDAANRHFGELKSSVEASQTILGNMRKALEDRSFSLSDMLAEAEKARSRMDEVADMLRAKDEEKKAAVDEKREKGEEYNILSSESAGRSRALSEKRQLKDNLVIQLTNAQKAASEQQIWMENSGSLTQTTVQNFFNKYGRNLGEFMDEYKDKDIPSETLIQNELKEVQKELQSFGNINYMAEQEYEESLEQYKFYAKHLEDLGKAKTDLEQVLDEITHRSEELFTKTYKEISANFQAMFKRLFGGGRAEITLEDPENVLTSGINILAQPPGKKPQYLNLLSGGERSMTAVALLFATYQVKPSPFCILDELDAALDDRNIGYFLGVLDDFSRSSQFIIITHNKHTVTGSQSLLGVTQMEPGVSITTSYRLESVKGEPVIFDDSNKEVDFDN